MALKFPIRAKGEGMNYATIKNCDIANGPGVRVSLFVSGCTHRCPGCFNEVAWDFGYGEPFTTEVENSILEMLSPDFVQGITLLGGEPFEPQNQAVLVPFLRRVKERYPHKSIWCFSGFLFEDILAGKVGEKALAREFLNFLEVLVDGPFILAKKNLMLRFRGSENQRIINVPASLRENSIILWEDWQGERR